MRYIMCWCFQYCCELSERVFHLTADGKVSSVPGDIKSMLGK
jgi:hypothetical protein